MSGKMEELSDDEIFIGKFTIKEFKKNVLRNNLRQYSENKTFDNIKTESNASIKIIETHSAPNLLSSVVEKSTFKSTPGSPALNRETADDSFIQLENKISELCVNPRTSDEVELNNTLEVVDYILNKGMKQKTEHTTPKKEDENDEKLQTNIKENTNIDEDKNKLSSPHFTFQEIYTIEQNKTPHKERKHQTKKEPVDAVDSEQYFTPLQIEKKTKVFVTPSSSIKLKPPVIKTPATYSNKKTITSAKKTPNRTNAYEHIASPIACYIKNCPQAPLVKDVHPRKPLPGPSSIPKLVKSQVIKLQQNKENIELPKVAYKNAKKTVLINADQERLPQSQWVKSTLPTPKVVKHEKREMNPLKRVQARQEESFANLSCVQAEVSICTQKTAFKSNK